MNFITDDNILIFSHVNSKCIDYLRNNNLTVDGDYKKVFESIYNFLSKYNYVEDKISLVDNFFNDLISSYIKDPNNIVNNMSEGWKLDSNDLASLNDVLNSMKELQNNKEFEEVKEQCIGYKNRLEIIWENIEGYVDNYLSDILGKDFYQKQKDALNNRLDVVVLSPDLIGGSCIESENGKLIMLGNLTKKIDRDDNEVISVYMVHEMLHAILPYGNSKNDDNADYLHCLIQYVADKELHYRLSGKDYHDLPSHSYGDMERKMEYMYPYFLAFLYRNNPNAKERIYNAMQRDNALDYYSEEEIDKCVNSIGNTENITPYDFVELVSKEDKKEYLQNR